MLYNLILVDDEKIVINGIQSVFQLEDYGFRIAGTYTNPQNALNELESTKPDLIITDIKMPQMNGLEFSKQVKKRLSDVEIVILSGYDEFEFAQTSIHIGVSDYLLKPIKKKSFEDMLIKVRDRIHAKFASNEEYKVLSQTIINNLPFIKNRFFLDLINGNKEEQYYHTQYNTLGLAFLPYEYVLIKFIFKNQISDGKADTIFQQAVQCFSGALKGCGCTEIFYTDEYICFLLNDLTCKLEEVKRKISNAVSVFYTEKKILWTAAVSKFHNGFDGLMVANMECDSALLRSFTENKCILSASEDEIEYSGLTLPGVQLENLWIAISVGSSQEIKGILGELFKASPGIIAGADYCYSVALIILLKLFDIQKNISLKEPILQINEISTRSLKISYRSVESLYDMLLKRITLIMEANQNESNVRLSKTTNNAIHFINEHYMEDISLSDIADHVYVSKNYLCHVFKKEINITLLNYLTETRIRKAKALLEEGRAKMYEIAQMTGFRDYAYFSQIFKKTTGMTPSEYRNNL